MCWCAGNNTTASGGSRCRKTCRRQDSEECAEHIAPYCGAAGPIGLNLQASSSHGIESLGHRFLQWCCARSEGHAICMVKGSRIFWCRASGRELASAPLSGGWVAGCSVGWQLRGAWGRSALFCNGHYALGGLVSGFSSLGQAGVPQPLRPCRGSRACPKSPGSPDSAGS